jgi:Flp pilus assembly protein TadD
MISGGLLALGLLSGPVALADDGQQIALPLSGPAYYLADEGYKAHARGNHALAIAKLQEAIRLRPDVPRLKDMLNQARAAQRSPKVARSGQRSAPVATEPGYRFADAAYKASARRDHAPAIENARAAVQSAPDNPRYRLLLVNVLIDAGQFDAADLALSQAEAQALSQAGSGAQSQQLLTLRTAIGRELAAQPAAAAYRALERGDAEAAIGFANQAVAHAPDALSYRLLLTVSLLRAEQWDAAERSATEAAVHDSDDGSALVLRGYARQQNGQLDAASADFDLALQKTDPSAQRNLRLIMADAALAAHAPQRALDLLASFNDAGDAAIETRRDAAQRAQIRSAAWPAAQLGVSALAPPVLDCSQPRCALTPGQAARDPGFDAADLAYKALDARQYSAAIEAAEQAVRQSPANRSYRLLLVQALLAANLPERAEQAADAALAAGPDTDINAGKDSNMLVQRGRIRQRLGQQALAQEDFNAALRNEDLPPATSIALLHESGRAQEARLAFDAGLASGALADLAPLELAYLAARIGANEQAHAAFARADQAGTLPETALEDAAFAAIKCGHDQAALDYFRRTIDAAGAQRLSKEAQALFDTRRAVATIERSGGVTASISSGTGQASNAGAAPGIGASNQVLQAGVEGYWRPFGYQNGRTVELFGRVFETLRADDGSATGAGTAQGTLGARWKPLTEHNLVLSFGRLIPLGSQATSDWLAQAGYSASHGTDLRVDVPSWWTAQGFGEIGRYLKDRQNYAIASAQFGRSYRVDANGMKLVLFPHLTMNLDYNARSQERTAVGAGPGVNLRYWWRENAYAAPASFVDLSLQYRLPLGSAQRARGWFISATVSY